MDEEESEDKSSTVAKRKREPDASPMEFLWRTLAGGKVWDSLINLKKIIEFVEQGKDEVKGIQMVQHLWKNIVKLMQSKQKDPSSSRRIDPMLLERIERMQGVWDKESPVSKARELVSVAVQAREASKKEDLDGSRQKNKRSS